MATKNDMLAYDFDLFDKSINTRSSAAPQVAKPERPKPVPNKPRSRAELRNEARESRRSAFKILFISAVLLLLLGSNIYGNVVILELEAEKETLSQNYSEAQSENVRLESLVSSTYSINNISAYAEEKLGMIKKDNYQTLYFSVEN